MKALLTHSVRIFETVVRAAVAEVPSFTYESEVFGIGAADLPDAQAKGAEYVTHFASRNGRAHRAEIRLFCTVCKVTGIKPGTKRKPCEACKGTGTTELTSERAA